MPETNPLILKREFLDKLLDEVEVLKIKLKENSSLIQEIYSICNHRDESGELSFHQCSDAASGGNFFVCKECTKSLTWSGYHKLKTQNHE